MPDATETLRTTPLDAQHRANGARMVPFAGWQMPLEFGGIAAEHQAVRSTAGLFDVSHMGQIEVAGRRAVAALQRACCNDAGRLQLGHAQYSGLLTDEGTFVDDLVVYRLGPSHFLLVVNASNVAKDVEWLTRVAGELGDVAVVDTSRRYALLALQGPASASVLSTLTGADIDHLRSYAFTYGEVAGARALIARTGYTGEDGFEIFVPPATAGAVWGALLEAGAPKGVVPCGLGARDTLRLEAGMRLYGQDIDDTTTPLEAGLGWIVGWDKGPFTGLDRLREQRSNGTERQLVGFELQGPGIARQGHAVWSGGAAVGHVTSGTLTPFLKKAIGLAYVPPTAAAVGHSLDIDIRGRRVAAVVTPLPFYRRAKGSSPS
jgi:aminomethyltransferase